jgi:hypothetical protein
MTETSNKQVFFIIYMKQEVTKETEKRFFIVTNKKVDWGTSVFGGIGVWDNGSYFGTDHNNKIDIRLDELRDVRIPWNNIHYIDSVTYQGR